MLERSVIGRIPVAVAALLVVCLPAAAQEAADEVPAIWKTQDITFYFQSFTTFYSCHGLERKLERILGKMGAKARVEVRAADCQAAVSTMPRVIMEVTSPIEATPEALAEREKTRSTRELAARVQGKDPEEGQEQFPARWKRISLGKELNLEPGDCELIEELQRKVLPKLAVRIVAENLSCTPNTASFVRPRVDVDALVQIPPPDTKTPPHEANKPAER